MNGETEERRGGSRQEARRGQQPRRLELVRLEAVHQRRREGDGEDRSRTYQERARPVQRAHAAVVCRPKPRAQANGPYPARAGPRPAGQGPGHYDQPSSLQVGGVHAESSSGTATTGSNSRHGGQSRG